MSVQRLRKRKKMSMMALSEKSGIKQSTISRIERGLQEPKITTAYALAKALDCTMEELLEPDAGEAERPGA